MKIKSIVQNLIVVMKYTHWLFFLKLLEVVLSSLAKPFTLLMTQRVIDGCIDCYRNNTNIRTIFLDIFFLVICTLLSSNIQSIDSLINEKMRLLLGLNFNKTIMQKAAKIEYSAFDKKENQDVFRRMGENPSDRIFNLFNCLCETMGGCLTIVGLMLVFVQISYWMSILFVLVLFAIMFFDYKAMEIMNTMFRSQTMDERLLQYYSGLMEHKHSVMELQIYNAVSYINDKRRKNLTVLWKNEQKQP
ncbi:MAG: hypothetical protein LUE12_07070 [Ruminococcus sp.]|nr:hypothetical protein [Ruminococcus sp.]